MGFMLVAMLYKDYYFPCENMVIFKHFVIKHKWKMTEWSLLQTYQVKEGVLCWWSYWKMNINIWGKGSLSKSEKMTLFLLQNIYKSYKLCTIYKFVLCVYFY
jgi:hypothetical protein